MKVEEYINLSIALLYNGIDYETTIFHLPAITCNDGFSISVQVHNFANSISENGFRKLGKVWQTVEWGIPSEFLGDGKHHEIFNAEEPTNLRTVGSCSPQILDELMEKHGGINVFNFTEQINILR